ncbi:hypothetical protein POM88_027734 [Heracleum sosnowskyi]|uniref:Uncharacterized protein n=1 Tax=Heracleum sosnowskyi TaxID=360622 RepID=A0AAD8I8X9_9APIA|nr:hypothetical protein POM88_027734 [Heracleum sosnowskyi]
MVLRRKPHVIISLFPNLQESSKYKGLDKFPLLAWIVAQACQRDLAVGLYTWPQSNNFAFFESSASGEALRLGFGDSIALSAETGQGMVELYEALMPLLEDYMVQLLNGLEAWASGHLEDFGQLISAFGLSSIQNYECVLCKIGGVR